MQLPATDARPQPRRSSATLWLIFGVCAAPLVASYIAFYFWQPTGQVNYGDLIAPRPLADAPLALIDGRPFRLAELKGQWILLTVDRSTCDERCREKLVYMRQVRLAQGKETPRIERVWLLTDGGMPDAGALSDHVGIRVARAGETELISALPAPLDPVDHIYVVDPLGNLMMRFPAAPDPRRMLKDVSRLLRHSKWK